MPRVPTVGAVDWHLRIGPRTGVLLRTAGQGTQVRVAWLVATFMLRESPFPLRHEEYEALRRPWRWIVPELRA